MRLDDYVRDTGLQRALASLSPVISFHCAYPSFTIPCLAHSCLIEVRHLHVILVSHPEITVLTFEASMYLGLTLGACLALQVVPSTPANPTTTTSTTNHNTLPTQLKPQSSETPPPFLNSGTYFRELTIAKYIFLLGNRDTYLFRGFWRAISSKTHLKLP